MNNKLTVYSYYPRRAKGQAYVFYIQSKIDNSYFLVFFHSINPFKRMTKISFIESIKKYGIETYCNSPSLIEKYKKVQIVDICGTSLISLLNIMRDFAFPDSKTLYTMIKFHENYIII